MLLGGVVVKGGGVGDEEKGGRRYCFGWYLVGGVSAGWLG